MSNYIFLTENFSEGPNRYFAISKEKIETLNVSETYDPHGQQVGRENAGDYSIENSYSDAEHDCLKALKLHFNLTSKVNDFDTPDSVDFLSIDSGLSISIDTNIDESEIENWNEHKINEFITTWEEENSTYETCEGFTYWDGHNFKTAVTSCDFGEPSHIICDEELTKELNEAIENMSFEKEGFGCEVYTHENWVIIDSQWQGTWASYELMKVEDYGYLQEAGTSLPNIF